MKTILITGALGHIGSHLIRNWPNKDDHIIAVDDMSNKRYCSIFNLGRTVQFVQSCVTEIPLNILTTADIVIHLAAKTDATTSFKNELEYEFENVEYTKVLVKTCEKLNIELFVFPSSSSVYGVSVDEVFEDNDSHINPQSPYAEQKYKSEQMIQQRLGNNGTSYLIPRFGTIFGTSPGMRFETAVNKFCLEASLGKPLTVWAQNYEMTRPYLGLNDCVSGLHMLINNKDSWNNIYNMVTVNQKAKTIVEHIQKLTGVELNFIDTPLLNQFTYRVNTDKIKNLGFVAKDDMLANIHDTLELLKGIR